MDVLLREYLTRDPAGMIEAMRAEQKALLHAVLNEQQAAEGRVLALVADLEQRSNERHWDTVNYVTEWVERIKRVERHVGISSPTGVLVLNGPPHAASRHGSGETPGRESRESMLPGSLPLVGSFPTTVSISTIPPKSPEDLGLTPGRSGVHYTTDANNAGAIVARFQAIDLERVKEAAARAGAEKALKETADAAEKKALATDRLLSRASYLGAALVVIIGALVTVVSWLLSLKHGATP
jgi:hypothetical protein